jgi:trigger factor
MNVTETQIDDLTREFRVNLPAVDIERKVEARLGELAQSMRLPGFRPGKVPVGLVRKRYGAAVKSEVVEQTINESSRTVISERGLRAALPPKVELAALPEAGDIEYTMAVELLPEIAPPDYTQITLERLVANVDEAEIDRRIERFAEAVGEEETAGDGRPAAEGDIAVIDVLAPTDDPWPFSSDNLSGVRVRIGSDAPLPGFSSQLADATAGSRLTVTVTVPEGSERSDLAGQSKSFDIEIKEVRLRKPAPVDDALAVKGGWENLEDMKKWLREQHDNEMKSLSRMRLKRALLDRLAELYDFGVPTGLLQREYESLVQQQKADAGAEPEHVHDEHCGHAPEPEHVHDEHCDHTHDHDPAPQPAIDATLSEEQRAEYRALALRRVRLGLVLAEIGRTNNLRVQKDELAKAMVAYARRFRGQEQMMLDFLRENPETHETLAAPILEEKVVDFVLEMAKVEERTVDPGELLREPEAETTSDLSSGTASA